jgi:hypothetical protein
MARYFFNFLDGRNVKDAEGSEHPNLESVRNEAVEVLADILKGRILQDEDMSTLMINVTDEENLTVLVVSLLAAVRTVSKLSMPQLHEQAAIV